MRSCAAAVYALLQPANKRTAVHAYAYSWRTIKHSWRTNKHEQRGDENKDTAGTGGAGSSLAPDGYRRRPRGEIIESPRVVTGVRNG